MEQGKSSLVSEIRLASRALVREFGFMNRTVAGTDLSVSAVHAIIEIGKADGLSSKDLSDRLILEKSTVSRLVKSLVDRKEIYEVRSKDDARMKYLHLTSRGQATLNIIDNYAEAQVSAALGQLDHSSRQGVLAGLQNYAAALKAASGAQSHARPLGRIVIKTGYATSIIGRIVELLGSYLGDGLAHLRWFIIGDEIRGGGVGGALLARALDFCDEHGYRETRLWTVKGLDAARRLYEKNGFVLADEYTGDQWGTDVVEQKFVRPRPH